MTLTVLANVQSDEASKPPIPPRACTINIKYTRSLMKSLYTEKPLYASFIQVHMILPHDTLKYEKIGGWKYFLNTYCMMPKGMCYSRFSNGVCNGVYYVIGFSK